VLSIGAAEGCSQPLVGKLVVDTLPDERLLNVALIDSAQSRSGGRRFRERR
jgi:hypothetical protein